MPPLLPVRDGGWYQLEIPARIDAVGPLCTFLTVLAEKHGLAPEEIRCAELSVYETCLNVIEHAYGFDPRGRVTLRIRFDARQLVLSFYDRGKGVNPQSIPPPNVADPLVRLRGRGFGLQMIRNSVDVMRYRQTPRGENNLLLIKRLSSRLGRTGDRSLDWREGGAA